MVFIKAVLLSLTLLSVAVAQSDSPLTITPNGYYLTVVDSSGLPTYVQIKTVIDLTAGQPPTGPGEPDTPAVDKELVEKAKVWAMAVDDPASAQAISAVYAHVRGALADGVLNSESVWSPLKQATDSGLGVVQSSKSWSGFRDKLTQEFTDLKQRGKLGDSKSIERALLSVQQGIELAADGSTALSMDQMVEIARRTNLAIDGVSQ